MQIESMQPQSLYIRTEVYSPTLICRWIVNENDVVTEVTPDYRPPELKTGPSEDKEIV